MANRTEAGTEPPSVAPTEQKAGRVQAVVKVATSPVYLAYLFGPAAFVAILVLMDLGYVSTSRHGCGRSCSSRCRLRI